MELSGSQFRGRQIKNEFKFLVQPSICLLQFEILL